MKKISTAWNRLISIGIEGNIPEGEARFICFSNMVFVATALSVAMYVPHSLYKGLYPLAALQSVDAVMVACALYLNYKKRWYAARFVYLAVVNAFICINSCYIGFESRVHDFFHISFIIPLLFYRIPQYKYIIPSMLMSVGFYMLYYEIYPQFTQYNMDMKTQLDIYCINVGARFVLFGIAIFILAWSNYKAETTLLKSNEQLELQRAELKRSNDDLANFGYVISHDLKAPVRNISSFVSLAMSKQTNLEKSTLEYLQFVKDSANRMSKQIDDMLAYSKVGNNLPKVGDVDAGKLVEVVKQEFHDKIFERNAVVVCETPLPVMHDIHATMIHHVFQNLIANGIKFNRSETPIVKVGYEDVGSKHKFYISDNGIGIDKKVNGKLFNMFSRLHTEKEFEGTGMGLAIAKKIVKLYNGEINYESEPGVGTTFHFTIDKNGYTDSSTRVAA
jgi:signal transduction histidine kinase